MEAQNRPRAIRVLSIRQPWAELIVSGVKRIENRSWSTNYRGPVLIHAGLRPTDAPIAEIERKFAIKIPRDLPRGGVVGIARLAGVVTVSDDLFFEGPYGLVMVGALRLPFIPATGALGLRTAKPHLVKHISPAVLKAVGRSNRPSSNRI